MGTKQCPTAASLLIQLIANELGKTAGDGPSTGPPTLRKVDEDESAPGFDPALIGLMTKWGIKQHVEGLFSLQRFQMNK